MLGLLIAGRMLGRAAGAGPKRPPADPKTTWIAWAVVITIVTAFLWWPALVLGGIALLFWGLTANDRKGNVKADTTLADLLAKYSDDGRRKQ